MRERMNTATSVKQRLLDLSRRRAMAPSSALRSLSNSRTSEERSIGFPLPEAQSSVPFPLPHAPKSPFSPNTTSQTIWGWAFTGDSFFRSGSAHGDHGPLDHELVLVADRSYVGRTIRLTFLAPDIIDVALKGVEPSEFGLARPYQISADSWE